MRAGPGCPLALSPLCDVGSGVGNLVGGATGSIANDILSAIVGWILNGANWLLQHIGAAITSTTTIHLTASWFETHYATMASIAAVVAVPMLLLAAVQALFQQNPAVLIKAAFVHLPLAGLLTAVAVQLVQLALTATDELCTMVSSGTGDDISKVLARVGAALMTMGVGPMPGFVATVGGLLIVAGGLVLWLELVVRAAAVYVAVLFLPLALASLLWPAVSHWCRRLVDTIAALVLSKFVVVAVLSLAAGALGTGTGFDAVLAGGALLLLAAFTPFTLLRLLPMLEVGAALQLEGARHRVQHAMTNLPMGAASFALGKAKQNMVPPLDPGPVGSGTDIDPGAPGASDGPATGAFPHDPDSGPGGPGGFGSGDDFGGGAEGAGNGAGPFGSGRPATPGVTQGSALAGISPELAAFASLPPELRGDTLVPPPGDIPLWEGDPIATKRMVDYFQSLETEPDGAGGGALPGVQSPLWGGNEPRNRFVPGPTDRWPGWPQPAAGASSSPASSAAFASASPGSTVPSAEEEIWTPWDEPDDPDIPSEYFFD